MTLFFMAPITKHFPIKLAVNAWGARSRPPDHMEENGSGKSVAFLLPVVLPHFIPDTSHWQTSPQPTSIFQ